MAFFGIRWPPTPTAAAEMATPVLAELRAAVADYQRRLVACTERALELLRHEGENEAEELTPAE